MPVVAGVPLVAGMGVEIPEVAEVLLGAAALVRDVGPGETDVVLVQEVEDPALTLKGAVCAIKPELSRRVRPMDVPDAMLQTQVSEVLFCSPKFSRALPLGAAPGRTLK